MADEIKWTKDMSTGNDDLDREHAEIIKYYNNIALQFRNNQVNPDDLYEAINVMKNVIFEHFVREENFLKGKNDPSYASILKSHRKIHAKFKEFFNEVLQEVNRLNIEKIRLNSTMTEIFRRLKDFLEKEYVPHMLDFHKSRK